MRDRTAVQGPGVLLLGAGLPRSWGTGVAVRAAAEQDLALGHNGRELVSVLLTLDDRAEHRRRLEGRVRDLTDIPEPTWDEVQQRAAAYAPWDASCVRVNAAAPVEAVAQDVLGLLPRRGPQAGR